MEKIYYIEFEEQIEFSFSKRRYCVFFNSKKARTNYKKEFKKKKLFLVSIIGEGEAEFNEKGILVQK